MATNDEVKHEKVMLKVLSELAKNISGKTPPDIADKVHHIVREITENDDPYKKLKDSYNRKALRMYPSLKRKVKESRDKLSVAARLAIAGNIIDFGPGSKFNLEKTVEEALSQNFAINHFKQFRKALKESKKIFYLADNAGEIVFDRILLEELGDRQITFVVKGGPIINDATIEDAIFVGIDKIAEIKKVSNGTPNTGPKRNSEEFINQLKSVDIVISKGQGNYEVLSEADANIFFLLKVKCNMIAKDIGAKVGDIILKTNKLH